MNPETMTFEEFLAQRMRDKGLTLKRLSEATGIAPVHIENMLRGNYEDMPSTPYFHGYVIRIGKVLEFPGEEWWNKMKRENVVNHTGTMDAMPNNRFTKKAAPKLLWAGIAAAVLIIIYLAFQFPRIFGKPAIMITYPSQNPYTSNSNTVTLEGSVRNADSLYINDTQEITIGPDGGWQQTVLLTNGQNPFKITAKKLLGGVTEMTEVILFNATSSPEEATSTSSSTSGTKVFPDIHSSITVPASGTFFE